MVIVVQIIILEFTNETPTISLISCYLCSWPLKLDFSGEFNVLTSQLVLLHKEMLQCCIFLSYDTCNYIKSLAI